MRLKRTEISMVFTLIMMMKTALATAMMIRISQMNLMVFMNIIRKMKSAGFMKALRKALPMTFLIHLQ